MGFRRGGSSQVKVSKTDIKRRKFPYRQEYLKHNPGMFCGKSVFSRIMKRLYLRSSYFKGYDKGIYRCAQCHHYFKEEDIEIDHILPISKWYGMNKLINCVATCHKCNRSKSNTVTKYLVFKGICAKIREEVFVFFHRISHPKRLK